MKLIIRQDTIISTNTTYSEPIQVVAGATITVLPGVTLNLGNNSLLLAGTIQLSGTESQMAKLVKPIEDFVQVAVDQTFAEIKHGPDFSLCLL